MMKEITMQQNSYFLQRLFVLLMTYSLEGSSLRPSSSWDVCDLHMPKVQDDRHMPQKEESHSHEESAHVVVHVKDETTQRHDYSRPDSPVSVFVANEPSAPPLLMPNDQGPRCSFIKGAKKNVMPSSHLVRPPIQTFEQYSHISKMAEAVDNSLLIDDELERMEEEPKTLLDSFLGFLGDIFSDRPPPAEHTRF
ncbi:MAG: hypothetical protein CNLJKLNK_00914 [Holosporales bacterium]